MYYPLKKSATWEVIMFTLPANKILHITTSLNFPRSSSRRVRKTTLTLATFFYYGTLHATTLWIPKQNVFSRKTNIALLTTQQVLQPRMPLRNIQNYLYSKRMIQKKDHDKTVNPCNERNNTEETDISYQWKSDIRKSTYRPSSCNAALT